MKTRTMVAAFIALTAVAACGKKDNETADTSTVKGMDTTSGVSVPVTDTVVKTTTTDTIQGEASKAAADSTKAKRGTKTKRP
ncbi:MAG TPA: hypothetical protein VKH19_19240 [Gemmatimonadaceae bacterium]|nr:hypothetical protein [Gemmatimonadaceae bacterium]